MIRFYLAAGFLAAFQFLGMYAVNQHLRAVAAEGRLATRQVVLDACRAGLANIREDKASDDEIDNLGPDDLRRRASEFLRPPGAR